MKGLPVCEDQRHPAMLHEESEPRELVKVSKPARTEEPECCYGEMMGSGQLLDSVETGYWLKRESEKVDPVDVVRAVQHVIERVAEGNLSDLEGMLTAQAIHLDTLFCRFSSDARSQYSRNFEVAERLIKLGLKCQAHARANIEAIAEMRNPPVFAKQANVVQNGQQQVVNEAPGSSRARGKRIRANRTIGAAR
jgi:hypothetical protein